MKVVTRQRAVAAAWVAAFVVVFAVLGAVARPSSTAATTGPVFSGEPTVPFVPWYWTMVVSPSDPNVLVLATSKGLYRSGNGGKAWKPIGPKNVNATSLALAGSSIVMGGASLKPRGNPSPVVRKGSGRVAPDGGAVLASSADGGKTWRTMRPKGLPNLTVQALAVDPVDTASLYALLNNGKLYRSADAGGSFKLVTSKLGIAPWALAIAQDGQFVSGDMDSGSHLSPDGKKWLRIPFTDSKGGQMVMEYAVNPGDPSRVLMSSDGIVMSTDSGKTWQIVLKSNVMFGPIAWAPNDAQLAYAIGFDRSLWRTDDGGKSWKRIF